MGTTTIFHPGDPSMTRLVKRLSTEKGLQVKTSKRWNGYGYAVSSYEADAEVVTEARAILDVKRQTEQAKERARQEAKKQAALRYWENELRARFPRLDSSLVPPHATVYDGWPSVPLDRNSRSQWRLLGYEISDAAPTSFVYARGKLIPLYASWSANPRPSRWAKADPERLWAHYQALGLPLVQAIWAANKMQKIAEHRKNEFYTLKDRFIREHQDACVDGRVARHETSACWACYDEGGDCYRCGGSGIYSSRTLYGHVLELDGRLWSFHSYIRPRVLSETPGADLPSYGRRFTTKEAKALPFRLPEYIRMLAFVLGERVRTQSGLSATG